MTYHSCDHSITAKSVLETACIKQVIALKDRYSDTTPLLKGGYLNFSHLTGLKNIYISPKFI